jgi:phage gp45-like
MMQLVQLGVLAGETVEGDTGAEHFQPYGFASVPLAGAEAVVVFPNGDRSHPLVTAVSDRRYRPTGGDPGQITIHNHVTGCRVIMMANGSIELQPAPGQEVFIRDDGGSVDRLVKKSEHDGHTHGPGTFANSGGTVAGVSGGAAAVAGTQRLRAQ